MAEPVMYAAWCRALLAIRPFDPPALIAAWTALAPLLARQPLVASPVAFVMPTSPTAMSEEAVDSWAFAAK